MIEVQLTNPAPIKATLFDGDETKFLRARVYNSSNVEVSGSPFALSHLEGGIYVSNGWTPVAIGLYNAIVTVYNDSGFTEENIDYQKGEDVFLVSERIAKTTEIINDIDTAKTELTETIDLDDGRAI